jgi:uncharacterized protein YndB with AHSA1/START domain
MTNPKLRPETIIQLQRTFPAPREKVFRAWTEPEILKKWWGPKGVSTPVVEIDLRVGGKYRFGMQLPDEEIFYVSGVYREVQPPEKLVFTWRWERADMDFGESQVTIEFHEHGKGTEVTLSHENIPHAGARESHRQGWAEFFEKFAEIIARKEE